MLKNNYIYRWLIFTSFILYGNLILSQGTYVIDTKYPVHEIDNFLKVYPDSLETFTPEGVLSDTSHTYLNGKDLPFFLFGSKIYWGKIELLSVDSLKGWTLHLRDILIGVPAWVKSNGKVDIFAYADEELLFHKKTGPGYNRRERDIANNWVLNRVSLDEIPLNVPVTLILKVEGNNFGYPPYFRLNLRGPSQPYYHEIYQSGNSFNIFMFGVTFIILLYHVLQYLYLRDTIFLYFSLWLLFCCMTMLMSISGVLDSINNFSFVFWTFFANSIYFIFWFFGRSFIQSKVKFPLIDKMILGLALVLIIEISIVISLVLFTPIDPRMLGVGYHYKIMVFICILGLILSIIIATRQDNFARYFGIGAIIGLIFLAIGSSWSAGLIRYPGFDPYAWGMFLQIVIFSFGIAYRRQVIMKENNEEKLVARLNIAEMQRIRDLDEIKSKFFANVSHEFRTPLSLILGPLQQAEKIQNGSSEKYTLDDTSYNILSRNANRLQNLVDQLLDLSKLESGHVHLSLIQGNLIQFLRSIVFSFESMAEQKGINFNTNFPAKIEQAYFDKDKLEKIVSNLISNAIKYCPPNGTVTVGAMEKEGYLHIEITDTGKGIKNEDLKRIFERFYRVEGSEEKGSGIGLALTKELVELHNGQINVASTIGEGTTFKIRIPYTLADLPDNIHILNNDELRGNFESKRHKPILDEEVDAEDNFSVPPITGEKQLVLIVEDNPDLRTYINSVVSKKYKTLMAKDGDQGERLAFEHIPDAIISDVMMPKKDGFALCNSLKNNQKTSHIPIIILTAKAGYDNKIEGLTQGADAYITKPFKDAELMIRIQNLIDSRQKMWDQFQSLDLSLLKDMNLQSVDDQFVQEVMHAIKENLDNDLFGVDDIARVVGFSRSQLHRKLKAVLNKSANQLIVEIRMTEAKRMLEKNLGNVSEVAFSVGYSNLPYFTKSFKKHFGQLPSKVESKSVGNV